MNKATTKFIVAVFLLIAVLTFFIYKNNQKLNAEEIIIKIDTIPELEPHLHTEFDSAGDHGHGILFTSPEYITKKDLWITDIEFELENAPLATLHHAGLVANNEPNQICGKLANYPKEIYAITPDMAEKPLSLPDNYGVFIKKGTPLVMGAMMHNPEPPYGPGETYQNVKASIKITASYEEKEPIEYYRLFLSDESCPGWSRDEVFIVPPETSSYVKTGSKNERRKHSSITFRQPGKIIYSMSHLHPWEGGEKLEAHLNNELVMNFTPINTDDNLWSWIIPHQKPEDLNFKTNDTLSIKAVYDNPEKHAIRGAMGMLLLYLAYD